MSEGKQLFKQALPVIIIAGPTASGKSRLALALAERYGGEIVNADSMQVYREVVILTARPSADDERRVPHHLYGIQSVAEISSAGAWLSRATEVIADIRERGKLPIVCGGTGLYLKVLLEGIAQVPEIPQRVTQESCYLYDRYGGEAFHAQLANLDPAAADRLPPADRQRLTRAHSVVVATGRTLKDWQAAQPFKAAVEGVFFSMVLEPSRAALYARIEARLMSMIEVGALREVESLDALNLASDLPILKVLGVPEFRLYLAGGCSWAAAIEKAQQRTRNFAKRQATWFRNQLLADTTIANFGDKAFDVADSALSAYLLRQGFSQPTHWK